METTSKYKIVFDGGVELRFTGKYIPQDEHEHLAIFHCGGDSWLKVERVKVLYVWQDCK